MFKTLYSEDTVNKYNISLSENGQFFFQCARDYYNSCGSFDEIVKEVTLNESINKFSEMIIKGLFSVTTAGKSQEIFETYETVLTAEKLQESNSSFKPVEKINNSAKYFWLAKMQDSTILTFEKINNKAGESLSNEDIRNLISNYDFYNRVSAVMIKTLADSFQLPTTTEREKDLIANYKEYINELCQNIYKLEHCEYNLPTEKELNNKNCDVFKSFFANQEFEPTENYDWHLEPTIEAEDIILSDKEEVREGNQQNYKYASSEYAIIKNNSKYGVIKYDGTLLSDIKYKSFCMPYNKEMWIINENSHENPDDVIITPNENSPNVNFNLATSVGFMGYYYTYSKNKNKLFVDGHDFETYFNIDANVVVEETEEIYGNSQNKNARYGIADKNEIIIPCEYENACMNIGNNIIALEKGGKWGYFDKNATKIIDFICEPFESKVLDNTWRKASWDNGEMYPYLATNGYIPVKIDGKCGYYDTKGTEVIPCGTFEEVRPVHNGFAWVKKDGKWGVIELENIEQETEQNANPNAFNISNYNGMFYSEDSNVHSYITIKLQSEKSGNIEVNISNENATRVSQVIFSGNIEENLITFEEDDGFGKNSYTIEFKNGKIYLTAKCIECYGIWAIPELNQVEFKKQSEIVETQIKDIPISGNKILWAVNKYLKENRSNLGIWLSDGNAYCPAGYMASNSTNWSCPINTDWDSYSSNEMAGAYPHFAYVDKSTLKCTITANYETVVEFDLNDYIN